MKREQLQRLHQYEIRALDELDRICKRHGLTYYMVGGTLLGAVRHQGFIPWDDDIDVALPRDDYDRFIEIAAKELPSEFFLQTQKNDPEYAHYFSKIRINNTLFVEKYLKDVKQHHGIYIDVWALDSTPGDFGFARRLQKKMITAVSIAIKRRKTEFAKKEFKKLRHKIFGGFIAPLSTNTLMYIQERLMLGKGDCYINWSGAYDWKREMMQASYFNPPVKLLFEGKEYSAPCNPDSYLRHLYGDDYMQLPPPEKRITHNPIRLSFDTSGPDELI